MKQKYFKVLSSAYAIAMRNFQLEIKEHYFGFAWVLLVPAIYAIFFILIKQSLLGGRDLSNAQYGYDILRAFMGITLFQLWFQTLQSTVNSIKRNKGFLAGIDISIHPFILAILFESIIHLLIRFVIIVAAVFLLNVDVSITYVGLLNVILSAFALLLSASTIGLLLAPWATLYADFRDGIRTINLPLILASPIFYPASDQIGTFLYYINILNPLSPPLAVLFSAITGTATIYHGALAVWVLLSAFVFIICMRKIQGKVITLLERI